MPCDLLTTELAACASGIGKIESQTRLLQLIAQLSCEIAAAGGGGGGGTPGAPLNAVQFNSPLGTFAGSADLTFNDATNLLTIAGNLLVTAKIDTANYLLINPSGTAIDWLNTILIDSTANTSLNWETRNLIDNVGAATLDWNTRLLIDSATNVSVDWATRTLNNAVGTAVVDWVNGFLFDSASALTLDWENQTLNQGGAATLNWNSGLLIDGTSVNSVDWQNRLLLDSTGGTVINWATPGIVAYGTAFTVGTLPAAGTAGRRAYVTDALGVFPLTGGGTQVIPVWDNGVSWIADGHQIFADNYGGAAPAFTPTTNAAIAFDTSDGVQYNWWGSAWH